MLYIRDVGNINWVLVGDSAVTNLGSLPKSGAPMVGAITGLTGLASLGSMDFSTTLKLATYNVLDQNQLDASKKSITLLIDARIKEALASAASLSTLGVDVAYNYGNTTATWTVATSTGITVPLPVFSDSVTATDAQVVMVFAASTGFRVWDFDIGSNLEDRSQLWTRTGRTYVMSHITGAPNTVSVADFQLSWQILAVRK